MELIQFLERNADGTAQWSKRYPLLVGFQENWVLDKTTDTAYCSFQYKEKPPADGRYCNPPKWKVLDWCRILHVKNVDEEVKYNGEGLPLNFSEYIISDIQANYVAKNWAWKVMLKLEEPIVRAYGVLGETLTYTNQTTKTVDGTQYRHDAYNHYTALERWLKVTPANTDNYDAGYDPKKNVSWFNRITILDKEFLESIPFADDTFNELNLYNVLMDNYDSSTGRTPVFFFDLDPATDLPRNPARDEYLLKFLRQDGGDKEYIDSEKFFSHIGAYQVSDSISNYATGLATNAQNISSNEIVSFPAQKIYAAPEVEATVRDVTGFNTAGTDDWVLKMPCKIKKVNKIKRLTAVSYTFETSGTPGSGETTYHGSISEETVNDSLILEERQYFSSIADLLNSTNVFWYTEGDNRIHVKEYCYKTQSADTPNEGVPMYYVEYEPLIDARVSVGDNHFVQQMNQTASQIDNVKYGKYMSGYLKGMNVSDLMIVKNYSKFEDFADFIGRKVIKDGITYLVTNVAYTNRNLSYDVAFQLNPNHMRKNDAVKAPQTIRTNIDIATDNIKERQINYKQTVKIGLEPVQNNVSFDKKILLSAVANSYMENKRPQAAVLELKTEYETKKLVVPITMFFFENQINFSIAPVDNAIIGYQKHMEEEEHSTIAISGTKRDYTFGLTRYSKQVPLLYTDMFGEVEKLTCKFVTVDDSIFENLANLGEDNYKRVLNVFSSMLNINGKNVIGELERNTILTIENQRIKKDMMEKMSINYAFALESDDFIICQDSVNLCALSGNTEITESPRIIFSPTSIGEHDDISSLPYSVIDLSLSGSDNSVSHTFPKPTSDFNAIAMTRNGKKLLICNNLSDSIKENIKKGSFGIYF